MRRFSLFITLLLWLAPAWAITFYVPAVIAPQAGLRLTSPGGGPAEVRLRVQPGQAETIHAAPPVRLSVAVRAWPPRPAQVYADSSLPLSDGRQNLPFSQIGWESADPLLPPGRFDGTAMQPVLNVDGRFSGLLHFYFMQDRLYPAGVYTGRVTYTLALP